MALRFIFFISIFSFISCDYQVSQRENHTILNSNIQEPIILIAGYGSKASLWEEAGFITFLTQKDSLNYGGKLSFYKNSKVEIVSDKPFIGKTDFFSASFSDSTTSIDTLSLELAKHIDFVLNYTKAQKVILVCYSLSGIVARKYLTQNIENHKVSTLLTIASPHQGTYLANLVYASNLVLGGTESKFIELIEQTIHKPINGLAIPQLIKSGKESYIFQLNEKTHPKNVVYHSIISSGIISNALKEFLQQLNISFYEGDFVSSVKSQNMKNITFFATNGCNCQETTIEHSDHFSVLRQHNKIADVLLKFRKKVITN